MIIKRILSVAFSVALCFALSCCSNNSDENSSSNQTTIKTTEAVTTTTPPVEKIDYEIDPSKPVIALTFDDGPNTTTTKQILDLLQEHQVKASFFVIGNNITEASGEIMKLAFDMGHEINNHSATHSYMNNMTAQEIMAEIKATDDKVKDITGEYTKFFRPPYIATSQTMYENIDMPFICGLGCNDWDPAVTIEKRIESVVSQAKDGAIILLHDSEGNIQTVAALKQIIPQLKEQGYQFVTVSELFEAKNLEISADDTTLYSVLQ